MPRALNVASGAAGAQAITGVAGLEGFSIRESAGTPAVATVVLRNGTSNSDPAVAFINLAAGETITVKMPEIDCPDGIYVDRVAGTTELALYVL